MFEKGKAYYYIEQDEDTLKWNIYKDEYYERFPVITTYETEKEAITDAQKRNEEIKNNLVPKLLKDLCESFIADESYFTLKDFKYTDPCYYVSFINKVNTTFIFTGIYYYPDKDEIGQYTFEVEL